MRIVPIADIPADAVERLLDRAFGPERHLRTAYRLRHGVTAIAGLSFAALDGDALDADVPVGTIQCWPVSFTGDDGASRALVMVGPVAVDPARQRGGIGRRLMRHALAGADRCGMAGAQMLIGDPEYYGRFFGFSAERTGEWRLPGPVERHRLLARGGDAPGGAGVIGPRIAVAA